MTRKQERFTGSIEAKDLDGRRLVIHIYTTFIETTTMDGASWLEGTKRLVMAESGGHVNVDAKRKCLVELENDRVLYPTPPLPKFLQEAFDRAG